MKETVTFDFYSGMKEIKFRRPRIKNSFILNFVDFFPPNFIKMKVILHQLLFNFQKLICRSHSYKTEAPYRSESPDPLGQEAYYKCHHDNSFFPLLFTSQYHCK